MADFLIALLSPHILKNYLVFLMSLEKELLDFAYEAGGSTKTIDAREGTVKAYANFCKENNIQTKSSEDIKARHVGQYINSLKENGISDRTLQNRMSHLRSTLTEAENRNKMPSNKQLGISGASREGSRTAMTTETYQTARAALLGRGAFASAACLALQRELGLRSGEAIMAGRSLATWERQLERGAATVQVLHGTKGGRSRESHPTNQERALAAVREARSATEGSKIMRGGTLEAARSSYQRDCRSVGLEGSQSPHSARYAYAQERFQSYLAQGYDPREAKSAVSMDLGHGSGRDRWVEHVYMR